MKKKHGKKFLEMAELIEDKQYSITEAVALLKKTNPTKFDASAEVHFYLGVDPKQADQNIRTTVALPHGTGKDVRIVAFVGEDKVKEAKEAGAVEAGTDVLVEKIEGGWLEFDIAIATPDQMKNLGKIAKTIGQKGLMPNPKTGTVTTEVAETISEIKKGKVEIRVDKLSNLHNVFGKVSFEEAKLEENLNAIIKAVLDSKPASTKGAYIKSINLTTSMGPAITLDVAAITDLKK